MSYDNTNRARRRPGRHVAATERFARSVDISDGSGCWNWLGPVYGHGYGRITVAGARLRAHRYSWILHRGEIPAGICVCHSCDNARCVNPGHLFLGSVAENNADKYRKNRQAKGVALSHPRAKGERNGNAKLTAEQASFIKLDRRPQRIIASEFGVTQAAVWSIKNGRSWA